MATTAAVPAKQKCGRKPGTPNPKRVIAVFKEMRQFGGVPVAIFAMERLPFSGAECTSYRSVPVSPEVAAKLAQLQEQVAALNLP